MKQFYLIMGGFFEEREDMFYLSAVIHWKLKIQKKIKESHRFKRTDNTDIKVVHIFSSVFFILDSNGAVL